VGLPSGTPDEARAAIERLIELTARFACRSAQLQEALDSRVVIEQAKGVFAERYSITTQEAFDLLRRASRSNRIQLHELAAKVVSSPQTPREFHALGLPDFPRS
jgi:AmiR/NasT family two-component response regulator